VIREALAAADPKDERAGSAVATSHVKIGWVLATAGDRVASLDHFRKGIAMREALVAANPANESHRLALSDMYDTLGDAWASWAASSQTSAAKRGEDWREARSAYQRSIDLLTAIVHEKGEQAVQAATFNGIKEKLAKCDAALK
jgi:hypothetical protein